MSIDTNAQRRAQLLIERVADYAIYMLNPDGTVASWNAGARRFKGYRESEILGQHFSRFYTPADRAAGLPERALATAVEQGRFEDEGWRVRKDRSQFWASVVIDPIYDDDGVLFGFAKITRDISDKKLARDILRRTEEQSRMLVDGVTDYAIYMLSPDGVVTTWNAGARRIKGYTADEVIGTDFRRFYTIEDQQAGAPARALAAVREHGRFEEEGWRVRKDGTTFRANVVLDTIHDHDGRLAGFAEITRDLTERQQLIDARAALQQADGAPPATGAASSSGVADELDALLLALTASVRALGDNAASPSTQRHLADAKAALDHGAELARRLRVAPR